MASITLNITEDTPTSVVLILLNGATVNLPFTASGNDWSVTDASINAGNTYTARITWDDETYDDVTGYVDGATQASGLITNQSLLCSELGTQNVISLSAQDPTNAATTPNVPQIQNAINWAEAEVRSILKVGQYVIPFTVNSVPLLSATGSIGLGLLQQAANLLAGFYLNKWRVVQSNETTTTIAAITAQAKQWKAKAEEILQRLVNWANGSDDPGDAQSSDLDLLPTAPRIMLGGFAGIFTGAGMTVNVDHRQYERPFDNGGPDRIVPLWGFPVTIVG